jgi:hypothetical protein
MKVQIQCGRRYQKETDAFENLLAENDIEYDASTVKEWCGVSTYHVNEYDIDDEQLNEEMKQKIEEFVNKSKLCVIIKILFNIKNI